VIGLDEFLWAQIGFSFFCRFEILEGCFSLIDFILDFSFDLVSSDAVILKLILKLIQIKAGFLSILLDGLWGDLFEPTDNSIDSTKVFYHFMIFIGSVI